MDQVFGGEQPAALHARIRNERAARSLLEYTRQVWPLIQPTREFKSGWFLEDALFPHLEAVARGKIKNLLINVPPGAMKSLSTSVLFPSWMWGPLRLPGKCFAGWSYNEDLILNHNRMMRRLVEKPAWQARWPMGLEADQNQKRNFENEHTGFSFRAGISGTSTGKRGDVKFIDDPHKVMEAESEVEREKALKFFSEAFGTRDMDADTASIVMMQRVHQNDLSGHIIDNAEELKFDHLCLPMRFEPKHPHLSRTALGFVDPRSEGELLFPELFPEERVAKDEAFMRSWGGDYAVRSQMQQDPITRGQGLFKREYFQVIDEWPTEPLTLCRGWDLAGTKQKTSPWSVGTLLGLGRTTGRMYVLDVVRFKEEQFEVEENILSTAQLDGRAVLISIPQDPGSAGKGVGKHILAKLNGYEVNVSTETGDKEFRARPFASQAKGRNVYLLRGPWNSQYLGELEAFGPGSGFKDQVDATSRAHMELVQPGVPEVSLGGATLIT